GVYRGDGVTCAAANCPPPPSGACCFPSGSCSVLTQAACTFQGGTYAGDNVTCVAANCPQPGACCMTDSSCVILTSAMCTTAGGIYHGDTSACATAGCWALPTLWKNGPIATGATAGNGTPAPAGTQWSEVQAASATCSNTSAGATCNQAAFHI